MPRDDLHYLVVPSRRTDWGLKAFALLLVPAVGMSCLLNWWVWQLVQRRLRYTGRRSCLEFFLMEHAFLSLCNILSGALSSAMIIRSVYVYECRILVVNAAYTDVFLLAIFVTCTSVYAVIFTPYTYVHWTIRHFCFGLAFHPAHLTWW